jgi:hypothetical protein
MPLKTLPGIMKLARSPLAETWRAPSTETSIWPPRIMAKDSALSKVDAPGTMVTVSLPAFMMSLRLFSKSETGLEGREETYASISSSVGYGPYSMSAKETKTE